MNIGLRSRPTEPSLADFVDQRRGRSRGWARPSRSIGVPAGTIAKTDVARILRKLGAGRDRWNVTVPASSSGTTPSDRSHAAGSSRRAGGRADELAHVEPAVLVARPARARTWRRRPRGSSTWPFEKRIPSRSVNVYVSPSSVGMGIDTARSGTTVRPAAPPARRYVTRPSYVDASTAVGNEFADVRIDLHRPLRHEPKRPAPMDGR